MLLENKVILVVGAGGLLGCEIVRSIVREGGRVVAADMDRSKVKSLAEEFGQDYVLPCQIDITDRKSIEHVLAFSYNSGLQVTDAVNTAYPRNKNYGRKTLEVTYEDFCENVGLHLGGYFLFMQTCARYAKAKELTFSLVNISSVYGKIAPKFDIYDNTEMTMPVEYAAVKSALIHLDTYFTAFMKGSRFRVNSVSPGGVFDKQDASFVEAYKFYCRSVGMLQKENVVGSVIYLLSDLSEYVCGQNLVVDDAFSI